MNLSDVFVDVDIYINSEVKCHWVMVDSGSIWNLLSQSLIKEYNILGDDNLLPDFKTLSGHPLHILSSNKSFLGSI